MIQNFEFITRFPKLYSTAMVCSFDPRVLYVLRKRNPSIVTAMIWRPWVNSYNLDGTPKVQGAPLRTFLVSVYDVIHSYVLHGFLWLVRRRFDTRSIIRGASVEV